MAESFVRPVTGAREPGSRRWAAWRFRLMAIVVLALLAVGVVRGYNYLNGAAREDPGLRGGSLEQPRF